MNKFFKALTLITATIFVASCDKVTNDVTAKYDLPDGLTDCKIYKLQASNGSDITAIRCPNSAVGTSYKSGKSTKYTVIFDGDTPKLKEVE